MYLVNAPWLFSTIWPMLSGFISPQGQEKIEIVYGSPEEKLLEHIDASDLPECFGGKGTDELSEDEVMYRRIVSGACKVEFGDELVLPSEKQ